MIRNPYSRVAAFRGGCSPKARLDGGPQTSSSRSAGRRQTRGLDQEFAKELVALQPDLILSPTTATTAAPSGETRAHRSSSWPVLGSGRQRLRVERSGNPVDRCPLASSTSSPRWPASGWSYNSRRSRRRRVERIAFLFNPATAPYAEYLTCGPFKAAAAFLRVRGGRRARARQLQRSNPPSPSRAREPKWRPRVDAGYVSPQPPSRGGRVAGRSATRHPGDYPFRQFAEVGGLHLLWKRRDPTIIGVPRSTPIASSRGTKPSELPVQAPVRFELVVNLKAAKALGLEVPRQLQQRADEVIDEQLCKRTSPDHRRLLDGAAFSESSAHEILKAVCGRCQLRVSHTKHRYHVPNSPSFSGDHGQRSELAALWRPRSERWLQFRSHFSEHERVPRWTATRADVWEQYPVAPILRRMRCASPSPPLGKSR